MPNLLHANTLGVIHLVYLVGAIPSLLFRCSEKAEKNVTVNGGNGVYYGKRHTRTHIHITTDVIPHSMCIRESESYQSSYVVLCDIGTSVVHFELTHNLNRFLLIQRKI